LTGRKTWRGFAPYVGGVLGVAIGGTSPRDTSGYKFGTKFTVAPNVGLRWYPARRLSVRGDVRLVLWKLNYPTQFKQPDPIDNTPVLSGTASLTEWTSHPWATIPASVAHPRRSAPAGGARRGPWRARPGSPTRR